MPREKEGFRDQLERLIERYPGRETLRIDEVCSLLGVYRTTLLQDKTFPAKKVGHTKSKTGGVYLVPIVGLARWLA